jgi:tRNA nucleotidyltransferase (CCA-adding enzyme)
MSFGVIKVKHLDLDISLPRRENKTGAGHRGFLVEVDPQLSLADAAARRDFTVNAIMYDPLKEELLDPHNGVRDLEKKILRHVSEHFTEDPLRVLRGMQFAGRMNFEFAPETIELCSRIGQEELAVERIGGEWEKLLLQAVFCSKGLIFLKQCRWERFYPELEALENAAWQRTAELLDKCAFLRTGDRQKDLLFMTAALISAMTADAGERFCRRLWNRSEMIGKALLLAEEFRRSLERKEEMPALPELRRIALRLGGVELLSLLLKGAGASVQAETMERTARREDIFSAPPLPILTGRHGIELGIPAGPGLGKVMKRCFEAQLDGLFSDLEGGKKFLKELADGVKS